MKHQLALALLAAASFSLCGCGDVLGVAIARLDAPSAASPTDPTPSPSTSPAASPTPSPSSTPSVATPTFSLAAGTYSSSQTLVLSCTTDGATIRYTNDGTTPTESTGTEYLSALNIDQSQTITAIACKAGYTTSASASTAYLITGSGGITVNNPPSLDVTISGHSAILSATGSMTVTASATPAAESYAWYLDGVIVAGQTSASITLNGSSMSKDVHSLAVIASKGNLDASASCSFSVQ
jgi:hypothetical protein